MPHPFRHPLPRVRREGFRTVQSWSRLAIRRTRAPQLIVFGEVDKPFPIETGDQSFFAPLTTTDVSAVLIRPL